VPAVNSSAPVARDPTPRGPQLVLEPAPPPGFAEAPQWASGNGVPMGSDAAEPSDPETDATLTYIRNKLAGAHRTFWDLRRRLGTAVLWGRQLQGELQAEHEKSEAEAAERVRLQRQLQAEHAAAAAAASEGQRLQQALASQESVSRTAEEQRDQLQQQLAVLRSAQEAERGSLRRRLAQDQENISALEAVAERREGDLARQLNDTRQSFLRSSQALALARQQLNETSREAQRLRVESAALQKELRSTRAAGLQLQGQLNASNISFRRAQQMWATEQAEWREKEAEQNRSVAAEERDAANDREKLLQEVSALKAARVRDDAARAEEARRNADLEKQVLALREQSRQEAAALRAAAAQKDAALRASRQQLHSSMLLAQQQSREAEAQEQRLEGLVVAEKAAELQRASELKGLRRQLDATRNVSRRLEARLSGARRSARKSAANLTGQLASARASVRRLEEERRRLGAALEGNASKAAALEDKAKSLSNDLQAVQSEEKKLLAERAALTEHLNGNRTLARRLGESVRLLKKRVEDGDRARERAQRAAERAEAEKEGAQAVARQLQGTVPQLLLSAQAANERIEAEQALRRKEAAMASRAQEALQERMKSDVQQQLDKLTVVVPELDAKPTQASPVATEDLAEDVTEAFEKVSEEPNKKDDVPAPAAASVNRTQELNHRLVARLAEDGHSLARLLSDGPGGATHASQAEARLA